MAARASADLPRASGSGVGARPALGARSEPFHTSTPTPPARMSNAMVVLRFMLLSLLFRSTRGGGLICRLLSPLLRLPKLHQLLHCGQNLLDTIRVLKEVAHQHHAHLLLCTLLPN